MTHSELNKGTIKIVKLTDKTSDFAYWKTRPYAERIEALEAMRAEYYQWKGHADQGFQRVCRVTKLQ